MWTTVAVPAVFIPVYIYGFALVGLGKGGYQHVE